MSARRLTSVLVLLAALAGAWSSRQALGRIGPPASAHELLYLPNGRHLKVMSLGEAPLLADAVYLWAIQYYSDYERQDRYRYVEHVFGDVIAELDPHYVDPYWLGALILTVEAQDLDGGLRLLDRGFAVNPREWILPYLAGWECYRAGDYLRAAAYFERAGSVPAAPPLVLRMRAGMFTKAGERREALQMWREILEDPRSDEGTRVIAERQIRSLQVRMDLDRIDAAVARFRSSHGRYPRRLEELVSSGMLPSLPVDPAGDPYGYDRASGKVHSSAARLLGPS